MAGTGNKVIGYVNSFESFATMEGGGIRYAVFFQGCPLRCAYCHNPDTQGEACGAYGAQSFTAEELFARILRYKPYFSRGGGVTLTGGEPLLQHEFLEELLPLLKAEGIDVAVDTSCAVTPPNLGKLLPHIDLFIADLKFHSEEDMRRYAGASLSGAVSFLARLKAAGARVWVRTVIVPGINDTEADIDKYFEIYRGLGGFERYELLGFHTLGFEKYARLSRINPLENTPALPVDKLERLKAYLNSLIRGKYV